MTKDTRPIMIVAGTRPEAIKLAPVIWSLDQKGVDYIFVWSGQHYDYEMSQIFFEQLNLPNPDINLDVKSGTHAEQTARAMIGIEKTVRSTKPAIVVAQGDTNTTLSAALASTKGQVPFAHVEAGLRSWDRTMPEEINRVVADSLATLLFAPTELAAINLSHEGIPLDQIYITGNTVVDVVYKYKKYVQKIGEDILSELNLSPEEYILVTIHRQENTENKKRLTDIVGALIKLSEKYKIVFPIHPRTLRKMINYGLLNYIKKSKNINVLKPLGYFEFLALLMKSLVVLTDSGGVQEEACTLRIPTLTLRYNTERPETVLIGINKVIGTRPEIIVNEASKLIYNKIEILKSLTIQNPLGDGRAGTRIAEILYDFISTVGDLDDEAYSIWSPMTYKLINKDIYKIKNNRKYKIISMYDENGKPVTIIRKASMFVIKLPYDINQNDE